MPTAMKKYSFTVPGKIIPKQRPRNVFAPWLKPHEFPVMITSRAHHQKMQITFTPKTTQDYKKLVAQYARAAGVQMMEYCKVDVVFYIPKTKANAIPKRKVDRDNAYGSILDGLQGVAYMNDGNTLDGNIKYRFVDSGQQERAEIYIEEVRCEDYFEDNIFKQSATSDSEHPNAPDR